MDVESVLREMTLQEKVSLLAGASHWRTSSVDRLGIPSLTLSDGPHGLRKQEGAADHMGIAESRPATCFPTASALACSFDPKLVEEVGAAIGEEARDQGVDIVLGPGVNVKRHPLCGRNFEYLSEDPYVSGVLGAAMVRGIQSRGVGACLKHLAGNSQEHARMVQDSVIDDKTLRELYLSAFEYVVRTASPWTVMSAYNRLNGTYCSEDAWLLTHVLRDAWGFDGAVVSDWGAQSDDVSSVVAGLDLCMPGPRPDYAGSISAALEHGDLDEELLDERVREILRLYSRVSEGRLKDYSCDYGYHLRLARDVAARSMVLLENDGLLPLSADVSVALIGEFARAPRYQGSGSSKICPLEVDSIELALEERGIRFEYAQGYDRVMGVATEEMLAEAERIAGASDVAIVVVGLPDRYESEGFDRKLMCMPRGHNLLIERVCAVNPRTIVVLQGGAPMEMPWRALPAGLLLSYLSGCQGGRAAADVLFGDVNPSGKLAETWPVSLEDTALGSGYPDMNRTVLYREGIYVGYRYYDAAAIEPAYPFGYGLSYTTFDLGEFTCEWVESREDVPRLWLHGDIKNTGSRLGAEVIQVYLAPVVRRGMQEVQRLVAFERIELLAGGSRHVDIRLDSYAFRTWDVGSQLWRVGVDEFELRVGVSSRDIRSCVKSSVPPCYAVVLAREANNTASCDSSEIRECAGSSHFDIPASYRSVSPHGFTNEDFYKLYNGPLFNNASVVPFTRDSTVSDMGACWLGRRLFRLIDWVMTEPAKKMDRDQRAMMEEMAADMPLRALTMSGVPMGAVDSLVEMLNGGYLTGSMKVIASLVRWLFRSSAD